MPAQPTLHHGDLPADLDFGDLVAVDTETMGLDPARDRLCLVQLSSGDGSLWRYQIGGRLLERLSGDPAAIGHWDNHLTAHAE